MIKLILFVACEAVIIVSGVMLEYHAIRMRLRNDPDFYVPMFFGAIFLAIAYKTISMVIQEIGLPLQVIWNTQHFLLKILYLVC